MVCQIQDKHRMEFGLKCNCKGVGAVTEAVLILFDSFQLLSAGHVAFTVQQEPCDSRTYAGKRPVHTKSPSTMKGRKILPLYTPYLEENINR